MDELGKEFVCRQIGSDFDLLTYLQIDTKGEQSQWDWDREAKNELASWLKNAGQGAMLTLKLRVRLSNIFEGYSVKRMKLVIILLKVSDQIRLEGSTNDTQQLDEAGTGSITILPAE